MEPFFRLEEVAVSAAGRNGSPAEILSGVTLSIAAETRWAVVGRSGSGKSTLLGLLNRMVEPSRGQIFRQGVPLADIPPAQLRREVAQVSQVPVWLSSTARDNLLYPAHLGVVDLEDSRRRIPEIMDLLGLSSDRLERTEDELSVGERQRIMLGRALMTRPKAVLLDEPTSSLDPPSADSLLRLLAELGEREKLTLILVTHRLEDVRRFGEVTVVLEEGRMVDEGDSHEVVARLERRWEDVEV